MSHTFEERISEEIDALYQGALFLCSGHEGKAEKLLADAVTRACSEYQTDTDVGSFGRWMEVRLVRAFLPLQPRTDAGAADRTGPPTADPRAFSDIGARDLFRAAAAVPPSARAALWLVTLRRRSYPDAATALEVGVDALRELLTHRDAFLVELTARSGGVRDVVGRGS